MSDNKCQKCGSESIVRNGTFICGSTKRPPTMDGNDFNQTHACKRIAELEDDNNMLKKKLELAEMTVSLDKSLKRYYLDSLQANGLGEG